MDARSEGDRHIELIKQTLSAVPSSQREQVDSFIADREIALAMQRHELLLLSQSAPGSSLPFGQPDKSQPTKPYQALQPQYAVESLWRRLARWSGLIS